MKYLGLFFILCSTCVWSQENGQLTPPKLRLGCFTTSHFNSLGGVNPFFNEQSVGALCAINRCEFAAGIGLVYHLKVSGRNLNTLGPAVSLRVELYKQQRITVPLNIYFNLYKRNYQTPDVIDNTVIINNKGIQSGVEYNLRKNELVIYGHFGFNSIYYKQYNTSRKGIPNLFSNNFFIPSLSLGAKFYFK